MNTNANTPEAAPCTDPGTDPPELRQRAERSRTRAMLLKFDAAGLERAADQLEHEAALWEAVNEAVTVRNTLEDKTAGFKAAEEGALTAQREAEDKHRDDQEHRDRRRVEAKKAENGDDRDAQDDAAARLGRAERRVTAAETAYATAKAKYDETKTALDKHNQNLLAAQSAVDSALQAAGNPGIAPRKRFTPGVTGLSDMSDDARAAIQAAGLFAYASAASGGGSQAPAAKDGIGTTRAAFAAQDPSKFRLVRSGAGVVAVPPHWTGTQPR